MSTESLINQLLLAETETEVLEFKKAERQFDKDKLGKYFSALSNEANLKGLQCAYLLFGINNDKEIVGTHISDTQLNEYKREISNNTSPSVSFSSVEKVSTDKGVVILLQIPAAPQGTPVAWKGHWYGREGESLGALNISELEHIRNQNNSFDWSAQIVKNASLGDLSEEAIAQARVMFATKNPNLKEELNQWDAITFLNKAKITIQGQITNAAILLLGKPEAEHFISPAVAKISWILKDKDGIEKDYEHFACPFFLNVSSVYNKIRNLKYRYIQDGSLFPDEVDQYDPYIIREGLNNCIAHQDYSMGGKINIVEREDGVLTFSNLGTFIPKSIESVVKNDAPESKYRNPFLTNAMVNLNMIDTIGSGIKKMFVIQKNKFFPLPDYNFDNNKVGVSITGKVVDVNYARKIAQIPTLSLDEIILLDKVAKQQTLNDAEVNTLKAKKLIEGRKPNFHISSDVAKATNTQADYIKQRGIDDTYCQKIILDYIEKFGEGKKSDFENILLDKLPDVLDIDQKKNKVKNNLQTLRKQGLISPFGKVWKLSKP